MEGDMGREIGSDREVERLGECDREQERDTHSDIGRDRETKQRQRDSGRDRL